MPIAQQQLDGALARAGFTPEEMAGEPLEEPRFTHGQVLAVSGLGTPYELASNEAVELTEAEIEFLSRGRAPGAEPLPESMKRAATSICAVEGGGATAIFLARRFHWPDHGLGPRGGKLWLSKLGKMVSRAHAPAGPGVVLEQSLGEIVDENWLGWDPQQAKVVEAEAET